MLADRYSCQRHTVDRTGSLVLFSFLFYFKGRLVPKCAILIFTSWAPLDFNYVSFYFDYAQESILISCPAGMPCREES